MVGLCEGGNEPPGSLKAIKTVTLVIPQLGLQKQQQQQQQQQPPPQEPYLYSDLAHMGTESICAGVYCGQHQFEAAKV
ncbi:hypothetical protein ANN_15786 [Periplaneta americana]|uniref:Uncharacterized protein n=1 Tax=Periplaneta americana TaxID=6978 RepID=A0ABQ8SH70_PERAM|nr:hypothetical protein ANN_15786 [Periplaneta americana]